MSLRSFFLPSLLNPYCVPGNLPTSSPCICMLMSLNQEMNKVEINNQENFK